MKRIMRVSRILMGELRGSQGDRLRQTLQERELDVSVQALRLEKTASDRRELLAHGGRRKSPVMCAVKAALARLI